MADRKQLQPVDLVEIGNLLEHLVAEGTITCEGRDEITARIVKSHGFAKYEYPIAGYGQSKDEVLERASRRKPAVPQISLTEIVQAHSKDAPGYVIQSWLRNSATLSFLNLWEKENNLSYFETGYPELMEKRKPLPSPWLPSFGSVKQRPLYLSPNRVNLEAPLLTPSLPTNFPLGSLQSLRCCC